MAERDRLTDQEAEWVAESADERSLMERLGFPKDKPSRSYKRVQLERLIQMYGPACLSCGREGVPMTRDHVYPVKRGWGNRITNLQPLCRNCNSAKKQMVIDFREKPPVWLNNLTGKWEPWEGNLLDTNHARSGDVPRCICGCLTYNVRTHHIHYWAAYCKNCGRFIKWLGKKGEPIAEPAGGS